MDPIETYAKLYDEVVGREHGKDLYRPEEGTVWDGRSEAEKRMARKRDAGIAETINSYVESVRAFDQTHRTFALPDKSRPEAYGEALPGDLVDTGAVDYFAAGEEGRAFERYRVRRWLKDNVDPIVKAEDTDQFERKLRNNLDRTHNADRQEQLYDLWEEAGVDWADQLWDFVTDDELGLKELAEERRQHNRAIAAHAQNLQEQLGAELDAHAQPSRFGQLKDRVF